MFDFMYLPVLLAQQQSTFADSAYKFAYILGVMALILVLPFILGTFIARSLRMRGFEFKIGIIIAALTLALFILFRAWDWEDGRFRIPLGVDLKGGVILIYEVDTSVASATDAEKRMQGPDTDINMGDLVQALTNRINPSGTKEIVIRPYGERQVEIIIPEVDAQEVEQIKKQIETAGSLEFRIVANARDHRDIIDAAQLQSQDPDPGRRRDKFVKRGTEIVGRWAQAAKEKMKAYELESCILRNESTGQIVTLQDIGPVAGNQELLVDYLQTHGIENLDVLLALDDGCNVTGDYLGVVSAGNDEYLHPCVNFHLRGEGIAKFRLLTSENLPDADAGFYRHLGIMLDNRLLSFPRLITTISDSGRITGNFKKEEVDFLVGILRAGRLPATLNPTPISENQIGSMLGDDTIQKGKVSIVIALLAVLVFVAVYYRFSGLVACLALMLNLVLVLAVMVLLNAPLTLPGLAGIVLTVGMSVDANVLIFERMREEVQRGAALRMAIRNGFARATTTIVDSNMTTMISALVLYAIGTDQIRGFAVTLILGIIMSMFTAIFCSRVVFDIAERRQWITQLKMMKILGSTHLDFISKQWICIAGSITLIVIGLIAVVARGQRIFDIDFTGGVSVVMVLDDSLPPDEVRGRLIEHFKGSQPPITCTVNTVSVSDRKANSVYKIDANMESALQLEDSIEQTFRDADGKSLLTSYKMEFSDLEENASRPAAAGPAMEAQTAVEAPPERAKEAAAPEAPAAPEAAAPGTPESNATPEPAPEVNKPEAAAPSTDAAPENKSESDGSTSQRTDLPADNLFAVAQEGPAAPQEAGDAAAKPTEQSEPLASPPTDSPASGESPPSAADVPAGTPADIELRTTALLTFENEISALSLRDKIKTAYNEVHAGAVAAGAPDGAAGGMDVPGLLVDTDTVFDWSQDSAVTHKTWYISVLGSQSDVERVLTRMRADLADSPVFPSSSKVGGQVAGDTRTLAIAAFIGSLFGIVGYLWIRFQHVMFGVAAVLALVHDALITLGAIALSAYVTNYLGFLQIDEFKINLSIVAAILTVIGYSVNDTVVIFDRIREVRGKSPDLTPGMINSSINQTLSRTLLTSFTTLIVVVILYAMGGQGIHGFAFCLLVGVVVGTYSSIYIASPVLLWMFNRNKALN